MIIPARNEASRIGGCLESIHQALEHAGVTEVEVVVVDDESADETSDVARAHGARRVPSEPEARSAGGLGIRCCQQLGSLLFFVDADCRVDKAAFSALLRGFARPKVGVVAARGELDRGRTADSLVERSATFSALMLHEIKSRLGNHDFLPHRAADGGPPQGVARG